ncbi:MAG: nitroreductase family protein [Candidatus Aphodosoma sp.]
MNTFNELLKNRRSIRKYEQRPVEEDKLKLILQAALMSPSSKRTNCWEFIVVDNKEVLEKMSECREVGSKFLADAPMAIVVCANPEKSDVWFEDASISAIILQLASADLGLGSCWIQVYKRMHTTEETAGDYIKTLLHIPDNLEVLNIVSIGYKNEERKPYDVEKLSYDKLHRNTF